MGGGGPEINTRRSAWVWLACFRWETLAFAFCFRIVRIKSLSLSGQAEHAMRRHPARSGEARQPG